MSSPSRVADTPIADRSELVAYIAAGEKPKADWRIGTEHEKFGFRNDDLRPPSFDGDRGIDGVLPIGNATRLRECVDRQQNLPPFGMGIADAFGHGFRIEIQPGEIAGVGVIFEAEIYGVGTVVYGSL